MLRQNLTAKRVDFTECNGFHAGAFQTETKPAYSAEQIEYFHRMNLTEEIQTVNDYAVHARALASERGLDISLNTCPHEFKRLLAQQEDSHGVAPELDPDRSYIEPHTFAWLLIKDGSVPVLLHAIRKFDTRDLLKDLATYRLYGDREIGWETKDCGFTPEFQERVWAGTLGVGGGLYVKPSHRNRDYSFLFVRLLRIMAIRWFHIDTYTSFVLDTPERRAWAQEINMIPNILPMQDGYWRHYDDNRKIFMAHASRWELLTQARHEIDHWPAIWSARQNKGDRRLKAS